jgi:dephospho-CoA kinase
MKKIAITGGIGSGKSSVGRYLRSKGYTVLDADAMVRACTAPGGKSIPFIRENFGDEYILPDGGMDRAKIRELVFTDERYRKLLEQGTTEVVIRDMKKLEAECESNGDSAIFSDIPLLFERDNEGDYDASWVVVCDREVRIARVIERDGLDRERIESIMAAQMSDEDKIARADDVIYNTGTLEELYIQIEKLILKYNI